MFVSSPHSFSEGAKPLLSQFDTIKLNPNATHTVTLKNKQSLFCEGDRCDYVYEVVEGVVRTSKLLFDGRRQVISFAYANDIVGLSHDAFHHSDCDAVGPVTLQVYRKSAFSGDQQANAAFCNHLLQAATQEVNNMQQHFMMLGRKSAMEKIASFLIGLYDRFELDGEVSTIRLPMKRGDIADFLGLTVETVSRAFTRLRKLGIIELPHAQMVCVIDSPRLRAMTEGDD